MTKLGAKRKIKKALTQLDNKKFRDSCTKGRVQMQASRIKQLENVVAAYVAPRVRERIADRARVLHLVEQLQTGLLQLLDEVDARG